MTKTQIFLPALFLCLLLVMAVVAPVLANSSTEGERKMTSLIEKGVILRKENALKEIDRRLASLGKLIERINTFKRLTGNQETTLAAKVQVEIDDLTALRVTIEADTDPKQLTEHKKKIVDNYRIYALFLPKITIVANADKVLELASLMKTRTSNSDALAEIAEATSKAQNAIDKVLPLKPEGYPGNKTVLQEARISLRIARVALNAARPLLK